MKLSWDENVWFSPAYGVNYFSQIKLREGISSVTNNKYKKEREAWIMGMALFGINKLTEKNWWLQVPRDDPPDMLCMWIKIGKPHNVMNWREVEIMQITRYNRGSIREEVMKKLVNKVYPKEYALLIYLQRDEEIRDLKHLSEELNCDYEVADVTNQEALDKAIESIADKYGRLDCLVNNAGLWIQGLLEENDPKLITRVVEVNTLGVILATRSVIPQMKKQRSGLIININSQGGFYAKEERSVYTASKWAITGFTKSIQPELAKFGIGVTGIYPGGMKTNFFDKANAARDKTTFIDTEEVAKLVEFLLSLDPTTVIPEVGIKEITN